MIKPYRFKSIGIALIFSALVVSSCNSDSTKQKELELKEKELALKEKELNLKEKTIKQDSLSEVAKHSVTAANKDNINSPKNPVSTAESKWISFSLPSTVGKLSSYFGHYTKFIPCEMPCDAGSTYLWELSNGLIINGWAMTVGEDGKPNKLHKVEAYELYAKNNKVIENLIFDLSLNRTSLENCQSKFALKKSIINNAWKFHQKNVYTYLWFNKNNLLIKISQYPFDFDSVN